MNLLLKIKVLLLLLRNCVENDDYVLAIHLRRSLENLGQIITSWNQESEWLLWPKLRKLQLVRL